VAGAAATFDCKLKAQSHFITSITRSTPSQSTDRRSVPWIKHAQREREHERERERERERVAAATNRQTRPAAHEQTKSKRAAYEP
jgi:hypothetical protein